MKAYDVVIIGHDITAYASALYLLKRFRKVAFVKLPNKDNYYALNKAFTDKTKQRLDFTHPVFEIGGLNTQEVFHNYLQYLKIDEARLNVLKRKETTIVTDEGRLYSRGNTLKDFMIYLIRHYPTQSQAIKRFKSDVLSLYVDFKLMRDNRFKGREYTIPKMYIDLGQVDLETFLKRYFTNEKLIQEFRLIHGFEAFSLSEIHALEYFKKFFNLFIEDSFFWVGYKKDFKDHFVKPVESEVDIYQTKAFHYELLNNQIESVEIDDSQQIKADYFIIDDFDKIAEMSVFQPVKKPIISYYIGLDDTPESLGIKAIDYLFTAPLHAEVLRVWNFNQLSYDTVKGIRVEVVEPNDGDSVLNTLEKFFPKIKNHVTTIKVSDPHQDYSSLTKHKNIHLNDRFERDHLKHLLIADNAFGINQAINQESGTIGRLMLGVDVADQVNQMIDAKENEMVRKTQDLLIGKILHGFKKKRLDATYLVQIDMGKRTYNLRMNETDAYIFNTEDSPDLIIRANYDVFNDLHHGALSLNKVLEDNQLEVKGDSHLFITVANALDFGNKKATFGNYEPFKKHQSKTLFSLSVILFTFFTASLYLRQHWIITTVFIGVLLGKAFVETIKLKRFSVVDYALITTGGAILIDQFFAFIPHYSFIWVLLAFLGTLSLILKRPFMFLELYKDETPSNAWSPLFKTLTQGLSILWILSLLLVALITYYLALPNQLLFVYVLFIMIVVSWRYQVLYINTTIKGRN